MGIFIQAVICLLLPIFVTPGLGFFLPIFKPLADLYNGGHINFNNNAAAGGGGFGGFKAADHKPDFDLTPYGGEWELHSASAGLSAMHLVLLPKTRNAVMFDAAVLGPSKVPQPPGHCRKVNGFPDDCWAHGIVYNTKSAKIRPLTVQTDTWCSSGGLMADGTLLQTGGYEAGGKAVRYLGICKGCDWREYDTTLTGQRWYASQHTMADGSFILVGGRRMFNYEFIPAEGKQNIKNIDFPFLKETTDMFENNLYPFVLLAPDSNLYIFANNRSVLLNPYTNTIVREYPVIPDGSRNYPASGMGAFLPIHLQPGVAAKDVRVEILVCGGNKNYADQLAEKTSVLIDALDSCGRMEITAANPKWVMETMPSRRVMGDILALPNAEMLMINGAQKGVSGWGLADEPNYTPVLYRPHKPKGQRFQVLQKTNIARMYHSTSAVLAEGKILVAGSNTNNKYTLEGVKFPTELRVEKFSPPYLNAAVQQHRPVINEIQAPQQVGYGNKFTIPFDLPGADLKVEDLKVTLYSPPFTTHGFSQNQRLLVLANSRLNPNPNGMSYGIEVEAPPSTAIAPKGYYLLFVVHRGIPSAGVWIQLL